MINKDLKINGSNKKGMKAMKVKKDRKLKWWHILLIVIGALIIVAGIAVAVIWGQVKDVSSDLENLVGDVPEIGGTVTTIGKYTPNDSGNYILCEYTELLSGETVLLLQKAGEVRFEYKAYWALVTETGELSRQFSNIYTGEYTPEETKAELFKVLKESFGYTDEKLAKCDMVVYEPVSFARLKITEVLISEDGSATVKYSGCAINGQATEYTLVGTYTKNENDFTFTYTELPEDELARSVAEKLLTSAKYEYYSDSLVWMNVLTFGDNYKVYLRG